MQQEHESQLAALEQRPSICCERHDCAYNDFFSCTAAHIKIVANKGCTSYLSQVEAQKRELEIRCLPFDLSAPVLYVQRVLRDSHTPEMEAMGFARKLEPRSGMWSSLHPPSRSSCVWVRQGSFEELDRGDVVDQARNLGYTVKDLITKSDRRLWDNLKARNEMSEEERCQALLKLAPPARPSFLSGKRWNGKIYGVMGKEVIYLNGEKRNLVEAEVNMLKRYLERCREYDKQRSLLL